MIRSHATSTCIPSSTKTSKSYLNPLLLLPVVLTLASCGSGSGAGDATDTSLDVGPVIQTETVDDSTDDMVSDDSDNTLTPALQFVGLEQSVSGRLSEDEFITYLVPENTQVTLRSNTGDSDIFLFETPDFTDESFVCSDTSSFNEDICSGDGAGDFLYATVAARNLSDYTLSVTDDCSVGNINEWVYRSMQDYYLFADQVPVVNPRDYDSPADLVRDLRFNELEPFSGIRDAVAQQVLFEEGREFGFGYQWGRDSEGNLRILDIAADSPFGRAGVKRGDIFQSLGGIIDAELSNEQFSEFIGTDENPLAAEWAFIDGETNELYTFTATQTDYMINTVSYSGVFTNPSFDGSTGYIVFNRFLNTSVEELDETIRDLSDRNVTELVLDLRYNGGGRVFVAERLAAQLSGNRLTGEVLSRSRYNDTYSHLERVNEFAEAMPTLDLSRVIVITTPSTASASELVINALSPYLEVVTVGERSTGKPFQSFSRDFCGMSLNAMNSELVNDSSNSVAGGIEATCYAEDDRTRDYGIGDAGIEGMLLAALDYVVFGTCDVAPTDTIIAARSALLSTKKEWEKTGDIELLGNVQ